MAKAEIFNLRSLETVEGIPEEENMHGVFANISKFFFHHLPKNVGKDKIEKGTKFAIIKGDNIMIHEIVNIDEHGLHIRSTFGSIYTDENPVSFTVEC